MSQHRDLLVELGTEELPPKALRRLMTVFAEEIGKGLAQVGLSAGELKAYASPRRLAVVVSGVPLRTPDQGIERGGPALTAAYDKEGQPTKALEGFARSCGVDASALERLETDKGTWVIYRGTQPGQPTEELVPGVLEQALGRLPIPKRMRWGAGQAQFVRPVHWLVLMHGNGVIPASVLGVGSGRETRGHRFHHPEPISIGAPTEYEALLRDEGRVIADLDARRERVRILVHEAAATVGGQATVDEELLDEVTALVEWPVAVVGRFGEEFLEVPPEALISSMQGHQRYFPVRDAEGRLLPVFITVANIESRDPSAVRAGNERVIRPRLADAAFFWQQDRKRTLASRIDAMREVVFQQQLGTLYEKSERVAALADYLARELKADVQAAIRAAWLAKTDLGTEMVGEFPELQGVMGRYYAAHDGESAAVAAALDEQYQPRFAGDQTADSEIGQILAIAERADTLSGIFAIGKGPSGDKDPFALRRAALGMLRTIIERELDIDLEALLSQAAKRQPQALEAPEQVAAVFEFCMDRLRAYYLEQGAQSEVFDAVAACRPTRPLDFDRRIQACRQFLGLAEAESLAAANKRIRNILRKVEEPIPGEVSSSRLLEPEEQGLALAVETASNDVAPLVSAGRYEEALRRLAALRDPVDRFFDKVLVMAEDDAVRLNRLALLQRIQQLFLAIADVSRLPEFVSVDIVVLDRDGVINEDSDLYIKSPAEWQPIPGSLEAIAKLGAHGYRVVVFTNQSGVGRGLLDVETLDLIHAKMNAAVEEAGGEIAAIYYCPHTPDVGCECRKPREGMLLAIARDFGCSLEGAPVIGDSARDLAAARAVGARPILVTTGKGKGTLAALADSPPEAYSDLQMAVAALLAEQAGCEGGRG